jgi:hypothetical protein
MVHLDLIPAAAVLDLGDTKSVPRPQHFGEVIHVDIVFGSKVSIGNIPYGIFFTDPFSCMAYLYQLQD